VVLMPLIINILKNRLKVNLFGAFGGENIHECWSGIVLKQSAPFCISEYASLGGNMEIDELLTRLAAPAQRALRARGITTLEQLSKLTEEEVFNLHGIGKNALARIRKELKTNGLSFSKK
jgi:hypothetical protein